MLACVCLNPSFDRTVSLCSFTAGDVNRVLSARQDVGGKGINVAITARRLGIASCVLGCAGKNGIDAVRRKLDGEQVAHVFLPVDGDVRTNMKIVPQDGTGVTELNEPGAPVNAANQRAFSDLLAEKTGAGQYVVLTGSLPPECPPEYYRDLMLSLPERLFVLDVSGAALMAGLAARPFLVKPNRSELQAAMNRPLPTMADVHQAALELLEMGAQNVLVSLGGTRRHVCPGSSGSGAVHRWRGRRNGRRCDGWLGENRGRSPCTGVWRGGGLCVGNDRGDAADSPR